LPAADGMGRVPALEVLLPDDAVRNLVRQGKVEQIYSVMQTNTSRGMQTMEQSLADLIQRGAVKFAVGLPRSSRPQQLIGVLERAGFPVELPPDLNEQTSDQQPLAAGLRVAGSERWRTIRSGRRSPPSSASRRRRPTTDHRKPASRSRRRS